MKSVAMFNNKGGVGKTTLTCNLASYIASISSLKVLVIDCDPQCNATQLILGIDRAASLYLPDEEKFATTIKTVLQPIEDGDSHIDTKITVAKASENRFGIDLLPGHPALAIIEDRLGGAWNSLRAKDKGGFRQTNWNSLLLDSLSGSYDLVLFDLGPSLGSINRSVLVGCNHFVTPLGSDIFSIIGVQNISTWLQNWGNEYAHSWNGLEEKDRQDLISRFKIRPEPAVLHGFMGYTVQQYITKSFGKIRRATKAYEQIIGTVDAKIEESLIGYYSKEIAKEPNRAKLGDIPHLYSLVPLAQRKAVPIHGLRSEDGLVGSQYASVTDYKKMIDPIAKNLLANINLSGYIK
jgi:cellulose biosynthesis protein BcsQ